jgi:hypothetical protein
MVTFTPKTDDEMRLAFILSIPRPESGEVWDRWMTEHDRKVAATALKRAAMQYDALEAAGQTPARGAVWLMRRANETEEGKHG